MRRSLLDRLAKPAPDRRAGLLQQSMPRLLADLGGLMHRHPEAILDRAKLPTSKAEIKRVLRMAWQMHVEPERRAVIEQAYRHLARFQDGVGDAAIPLAKRANIENEEVAQRWAAAVEAEERALVAEFEAFKARCAKP